MISFAERFGCSGNMWQLSSCSDTDPFIVSARGIVIIMSVLDDKKKGCPNIYACSRQILAVQTLTLEQWSSDGYIKKEP